MKLHMFRIVRLSIIRSLFTVHLAMVYDIQVCRQLSIRSICSWSKAVYKPILHITLLSVQWIKSWWWTEELSETCRVSRQNKFIKLVHLVGFITKKPYVNGRPYLIPSETLQLLNSFIIHFWGPSAELLPIPAVVQVMSSLFVVRHGKARLSPDVFS